MLRAAVIALCTGACVATFPQEGAKPAPEERFQKDIRPILQRHCYDCHGNDSAKADLNLEIFDSVEKIAEMPEIWENVYERVFSFEMPPPGKKELDFNRQRRLVEWLQALPKPERPDCDQIASDRNANFYRGHVMSRRLNRAEYANTVRDLFGVAVPVEGLLPADSGGGEGFDTVGSALFTSSIHIEKYLAAADRILGVVLPDEAANLSLELKAARDRILGNDPSPEADAARETAREVIARMSRLAYRAPASERDLERALSMFDRVWNRGDGYVPAVRLALKSVLLSPNFLFLVEPEPEEKGVQPLGAFPLASRLSYFLWSSMPDEALLDLAESGQLLDPNVYRHQVRRMLADPKAKALGDRFALQWLSLQRLGADVKPDAEKFPEFDSDLQGSMIQEATALFNYLVHSDSSLLNLIDSEFTFLNRRLAELYDIEGVSSDELVKVNLPDKNRGGIVGMAAVHALTSYPSRTSPVLRGHWVLEALLGEKIKPPPPDTPALEETIEKTKNLSLREQLAIHRQDSVCASCHDKMDPLGFGMENFDVLGRWRTEQDGFPVDAAGTLPSGETFTGPAGLKKILMSRKDAVVKHLVRKMAGYAFGRELNRFDSCVVDKTIEELAANEYRPSVMIEQIAMSFPFRHRFYPRETTQVAAADTN